MTKVALAPLPLLVSTVAIASPSLCILRQSQVAGLEPAALGPALVVEARKAGIALSQAEAASTDACPAEHDAILTIGVPRDGAVLGAAGGEFPIDLLAVDPLDRAQEVARRVLAILATPGAGTHAAAVGRWPQAPTGGGCRPCPACPPAQAAPPSPASGYLQAGARYEFQPEAVVHAGVVDIEAGAMLLGSRLLVGARAGWQPEVPASGGPVAASVQVVPATLLLRGAFPLSPVTLRVGLGVGMEWRRVRVEPSASLSRPERDHIVPVIEAEGDVVIPAGPTYVSLAVAVRAYPERPVIGWNGLAAYVGPSIGFGAAVRVGTSFTGGP